MGSAKFQTPNPQSNMENKTSKAISIIKSFFHSKRKEKPKIDDALKPDTPKPEPLKLETPNPVDSVIETLKKLDLKTEKNNLDSKTEQKTKEDSNKEEEDEFENFNFKIVEDDRRSARIDSQSSEDSGFSDVKDHEEVLQALDKLNLEDKTVSQEEKKKKSLQVFLKRGPDRNNRVSEYNTHPYNVQKDRNQINQVNRKALCGGHVTVNTSSTSQHTDNYSEFDIASKEVEIKSQTSLKDTDYWEDLMDYIKKDTAKNDLIREIENFNTLNLLLPNSEIQNHETFQSEILNPDLAQQNLLHTELNTEMLVSSVQNTEFQFPSPINEYTTHLPNYEESIELTNSIINFDSNVSSIFPTPPRSENVPSPMSESQVSFYPTNSDYTLSPERSSPNYTSDFEKYQEISQFEEFPEKSEVKGKERNNSVSSLTLKNFKDMQKDLGNVFSKKECCSISRLSCKDIFDGHMSKLKTVERKTLCLKISKLDLKTSYGVLQHVLLSLSRGSEQEDLQTALFVLVLQRVLAQSPNLFLSDFGLNLLKSAALRCPHRPYLTRCVVDSVYTALKQDPTLVTKDYIFHEVDAQGDNLIVACARGGDEFALVLAELTRTDEKGSLPSLFKLEHVNSDGLTALHVACSLHSVTSSRLHTVHVLLDHANVDIWKGDARGGDTALHLAVNSTNCDLHLILVLFRHIDRKLWKKLAHYQNLSSVTPLEYARSATRSTTRQNYPPEVLSFLMKCR